ncbi:hypothetical protein PIB30_069685, partial [Stylosanthes scabra]|nr:hypothetical protein [Stylosanthes scabra]
MLLENGEFSIIPMWIQMCGAPEFCKTKEVARKIGERIGAILDADLFVMRPRDERFMKVRVEVDITKPLQSIRVASPKKNFYEIQLTYKKLGVYCCYCGYLGHDIHSCDQYLEFSMTEHDINLKWRNDLKANQMGWRLEDMKENLNPNSNRKSSVFKQYDKKPTPISLLKSFANLSCKDSDLQQKSNAEANNTFALIPPEDYCNITGVKWRTEVTDLEAAQIRVELSEESIAERGEGANPKVAPPCHEDDDVELSGFGETLDSSQHQRDHEIPFPRGDVL